MSGGAIKSLDFKTAPGHSERSRTMTSSSVSPFGYAQGDGAPYLFQE
jgi:hypothetical protein